MRAVLCPLGLLLGDDVVEDVLAKDLAHELGGLEVLDGLAQRGGKTLDAHLAQLGLAHLRHVLRQGGRQRQHLLKATQTGGEHTGKGQVRVAGRVGAAQVKS